MKIPKNNYSPNDRFLIKIFIKIISLDSSQRVPPMSPCPPLIITTVCPWLINHLSDPWDFNNSNGILLRSNWRKPYPKFYGSSFYGSGCVYLGVVKKTSQKVPPYLLGGGPFINPVLALYIYISSLYRIYIYYRERERNQLWCTKSLVLSWLKIIPCPWLSQLFIYTYYTVSIPPMN